MNEESPERELYRRAKLALEQHGRTSYGGIAMLSAAVGDVLIAQTSIKLQVIWNGSTSSHVIVYEHDGSCRRCYDWFVLLAALNELRKFQVLEDLSAIQ